MAKEYVVTSVSIQKQPGTDRTLYATWQWNESHTDHFEVNWQYQTGNGVWFAEGVTNSDVVPNVPKNQRQAFYSAPSNALKVRVQVKPISEQYDEKVNDKNVKTNYWNAKWSSWSSTYTFNSVRTVSVPKISVAAADLPAIHLLPRTANTVFIEAGPGTDFYRKFSNLADSIAEETYITETANPDLVDKSSVKRVAYPLEGMEYQWQYKLSGAGTTVWMAGESNVSEDTAISYQYPETTDQVRYRIRPVAATYDSKIDSSNHELFTCDYSAWKTVTISSLLPKIDTHYTFGKDAPGGLGVNGNNWVYIELETGSATNVQVRWFWGRDVKHPKTASKTQREVDSYNYSWRYKRKYDGVFIYGGGGNVLARGNEMQQFTFTPPANGVDRVEVSLRPIAKTQSAYGQEYPYWVADWSGYIFGEKYDVLTKKDVTELKNPVSNLLIKKQAGSASKIFASWYWGTSNTENYDVTWQYKTSDGTWFEAEDHVSTNMNDLYEPDQAAVQVRCKVTPNATSYTDSHGREIPYWSAPSSDWAYFNMSDLKPNIPPAGSIKTITIGKVDGTERNIYANLSWTTTHTDSYTYKWSWSTTTNKNDKNAVWFDQSESSSDTTIIGPYTAPASANFVRIKAIPIAETHEVDTEDILWWEATWSDWVYFNLASLDPTVPGTPTLTYANNVLTATVSNYTGSGTQIEFDFVQSDTKSVATKTGNVITSTASVKYTPALGFEYKVRARAIKGTNKSEWSSYSSNVGTGPGTPAKITSCKAKNSTTIEVNWSKVDNADTYKIEYASNKGYFDKSDQVKSDETESNITTRLITFTGEDLGKTWYFRVRAQNSNGNSGWTPIVSCILAKTPNAPTTWTDYSAISLGETVTFYWVHNAEDNSNETYAQIRYYLSSAPTTPVVINITDTVTDEDVSDMIHSYEFSTSSFATGQLITWSIRTKGADPDWSPYSAERQVGVYEAPTMSFSLDDTITSYPIELTASAEPAAQNAVTFNVQIIANESYSRSDYDGETIYVTAGAEVFSRYYNATSNSLDVYIGAGDAALENGISYTITVSASMDSGLIAASSREFTVEFDYEYDAPNASISLNYNDYSATITPFCIDDDSELVDDTTLSVYRREYDGQFTLIASDIPNDQTITVTDPHPALDYARYRIVALSLTTGIVTYYDLPGVAFGVPGIIVQWDETWSAYDPNSEGGAKDEPSWSGSLLHLPYNVDVSDSHQPDVSLIEYIGRKSPVSYFGTQQGISGTWNTVIPATDTETLYALRRLSIYPGDVYVRESSGIGYWANITVNIDKKNREVTIPVTLNITKVEGGV